MKRYPAKVISSGITIGTIKVMQKEKIQIEKKIYIDSKTYEAFETNLHEGKQLIKKVYKNS